MDYGEAKADCSVAICVESSRGLSIEVGLFDR